MQFSVPKITTRNGFFAIAIALLGVTGWNAVSAATYHSAPGADPGAELTGWLMTVAPGVLAALAGLVGKWLGIAPEYVSAMKDFAKNPSVVEFEKRAVNAAVEFLMPRLGKYPELLIYILRSVAPAYKNDPAVSAAITSLGAGLSNSFLSPATPKTGD